ncbi:MAG: tail fiber protein [Myxococcota bacterium]|nr:tail fiber protein [Myxococcota bacterium]
MSEPFVGEIRMFAGNFAPRGWAFCDGQLLAVSQNDALFSLFGTLYGGDGRTTFGLPDLRGRLPVHPGSGPGLTPRRLGEKAGAERVTVSLAELPSHGHPMQASADPANSPNPGDRVLAETLTTTPYIDDTDNVSLAGDSISRVGGSQAHDNLMPFLCVHFIVALVGIYPSRN